MMCRRFLTQFFSRDPTVGVSVLFNSGADPPRTGLGPPKRGVYKTRCLNYYSA